MKSLTLGERIHLLRTKNGYSQEMLSSAIGVSRQCISHYESGRRVPELHVVFKIAETFGVPVDTLLSNLPKPKKAPQKSSQRRVSDNNITIGVNPDKLSFTTLSTQEATLIKYFRKASEELREEILALAKSKN